MSTKAYTDILKIPENIKVELVDNVIKVKGAKGEIQKKLLLPKIVVKKDSSSLSFASKNYCRKDKRIINTHKALIKSMFRGVTEGYVYRLKVCSGHFPITTELKGNVLIIKNFFGEKIPRKAKILDNIRVAIKGADITVEGLDKELTGQTAANIERATKIRNRDRRVFMDGIWIVEKEGKPIK